MVNEIEVKKTVTRNFTCCFPETDRIKGIKLEVETTNDKISNVRIYGTHSSSISGSRALMELAFEYPDIFNKLVDTIRREIAPDIAERVLEEATKGGK